MLFKSTDLINWDYVGELLSDGKYGGVIECPDLFELEDKYVLMFSSIKSMPHRVCFAVGDFDGSKFINDNEDNDTFPIEIGPDFYAPQTFEAPDGRRILIGWMYNWNKTAAPGAKQAGAFTIPRELSFDHKDRLIMNPIDEIYREVKKESRFVFYDRGMLKITFEGKTIYERAYAEEPELMTLEDYGVVEVFINGGTETVTTYIC